MQKTKLGLPVGIVAMATYLIFFYGGYVAGLLAVGYILLCESDTWLKRSALKTVVVALLFSVLNTLVYLLPNILDIFTSLLNIFRVYPNLSIIDNIAGLFASILGILKLVAYLTLAILALFRKSINIKFLDNLID